MEQREILGLLVRHRRRRWWPWRCRCGLRFPCNARLLADDEWNRHAAALAVSWYPSYFAGKATRWLGTRRPR